MMRFRRGMVLLGVMVVVAMAALAGTTAMYLAQAELASSRTAMKHTQARAIAWSGVQAVMAEMEDQREKLLDGAAPELTKRWELFEEEGGPRGVVRLTAWTEDGPTAQSENAKLDVNSATAEMLKALGIDEKTAGAIVGARDKSRFASVGDLTRIGGFDAKLLEREEEPEPQSRGRGGVQPSPGPGASGASSGGASSTGSASDSSLADLITVFSFDPNIQSGLGDNGSEHRGKMRVNLHVAWSDRLAAAVDERFGQGASAGLKAMFDRGAQFKTLADVAAAAQQAGLAPTAWPPVFDALTVTDDPYLIGCVDLNRAPAAVLSCIPGISQGAADQIVQMRDKLDDEARRTVCWPLIQGVLKVEEFEKAVDHLTTRSMQWRVRVEAGLGAPGEQSGDVKADEPLTDRVVLEAVIDVASERPRVAYLREVTLEKAMASVYASTKGEDGEHPTTDVDDGAPPPAPTGPTGPTGDTGGLHLDTDLHLSTDLDLGSGMDKGVADLNLGASGASGPIDKGTAAPTGASEGAAGVDRRVGRWTVGGGKGSGG